MKKNRIICSGFGIVKIIIHESNIKAPFWPESEMQSVRSMIPLHRIQYAITVPADDLKSSNIPADADFFFTKKT